MNLHHKSYDNLGRETEADVLYLCRFHHVVIHLATVPCALCGKLLFPNEAYAHYYARRRWNRFYKRPMRIVQLARKSICRKCEHG